MPDKSLLPLLGDIISLPIERDDNEIVPGRVIFYQGPAIDPGCAEPCLIHDCPEPNRIRVRRIRDYSVYMFKEREECMKRDQKYLQIRVGELIAFGCPPLSCAMSLEEYEGHRESILRLIWEYVKKVNAECEVRHEEKMQRHEEERKFAQAGKLEAGSGGKKIA